MEITSVDNGESALFLGRDKQVRPRIIQISSRDRAQSRYAGVLVCQLNDPVFRRFFFFAAGNGRGRRPGCASTAPLDPPITPGASEGVQVGYVGGGHDQ